MGRSPIFRPQEPKDSLARESGVKGIMFRKNFTD